MFHNPYIYIISFCYSFRSLLSVLTHDIANIFFYLLLFKENNEYLHLIFYKWVCSLPLVFYNQIPTGITRSHTDRTSKGRGAPKGLSQGKRQQIFQMKSRLGIPLIRALSRINADLGPPSLLIWENKSQRRVFPGLL